MSHWVKAISRRTMNCCFDVTLGREIDKLYRATFHTIHAVNKPRRLQAAVRTQFVVTSFRYEAVSKPRARRLCCGTCRNAVDAQITISNARPARAANSGTAAGRYQTKATALKPSTSIGGPTTHEIRRVWLRWYPLKSPEPTSRSRG